MDEACTGVTDTDTDTDCPDNVVAIVSSDTELDAALEDHPGGGTILLNPGTYGCLQISGKSYFVTLRL
jgi:polygalacturonase